ncbi:hypothetical protein Tco_1012684 [Tanacetum coccineum]
MEILLEPTSNKLLVEDPTLKAGNPVKEILLNSIYLITGWSSRIQRWRWRYLIPAESNSLPHAHAQTTKIYYKHQDLRIKKAQELKTKTSANSDIKDSSLETKLRGDY